MLYTNVDEQGQIELKEEMTRTKDKKWYRRLKIIDLSAQGHNVPELAVMFDLSEHTIRVYIKAYNEGGLAGLRPVMVKDGRCCWIGPRANGWI